ncbi:iron ABC transporter permease [Actinobaculum suis]|uniref:ABC transporter permease n=1 Tax=Actinobaculum suis TaxID=1657 RepID=UPI0008086E42|nr:iron ABC transporter permease [Actinobaculum suis]OCA94759.1 iron ABC transporter permease [Actinobaculum suis]
MSTGTSTDQAGASAYRDTENTCHAATTWRNGRGGGWRSGRGGGWRGGRGGGWRSGRPRWARPCVFGISLLPCVFLLAFFAWPVLAMLGKGIGAHAAAASVLSNPRTWKIFGQTLWMAAAGTIGSLFFGIPGAYVLYRLRLPGRRFWRALSMIPFVLPTVVVGVAFRALLGPAGPYGFLHLDKTTWAVVAAMVFFNFGVVVRTVGSLWETLPPHNDAARTLGASPARAFFTVTLPELAPAIAAAGAMVFLFCSTAYGLVRTLGTPGYGTLETEIYTQTNTFLDLESAAIYSALQLVVVLVAVAVANYFRNRTPLALRRRPLRRPGRADVPAIAITGFALVFLLAVPIANLVLASLRRGPAWSLANYTDLARAAAGGISVLEALWNSVRAALGAAAVALIIGAILAFVLSRGVANNPPPARRGKRGQHRQNSPQVRNGRIGQWWWQALEGLSLMPLGISAVTLGFGTFLTLRLTVENTQILVPAVQAVVALPLVTRAMLPVLRAINPRLREAAACLGAGPVRSFLTVDARMALPALGVAAGFGLAVALGEFGASSFLATGTNQTLPVLIERLINRPGPGNYGMAMAASVILGGLCGGLMLLCESLSTRRPAGAENRRRVVAPATARAGAQLVNAQPASARLGSAQPASAQRGSGQLASAKPASAQPASAKPASAQPVNAQPVNAQPASAQSVGARCTGTNTNHLREGENQDA